MEDHLCQRSRIEDDSSLCGLRVQTARSVQGQDIGTEIEGSHRTGRHLDLPEQLASRGGSVFGVADLRCPRLRRRLLSFGGGLTGIVSCLEGFCRQFTDGSRSAQKRPGRQVCSDQVDCARHVLSGRRSAHRLRPAAATVRKTGGWGGWHRVFGVPGPVHPAQSGRRSRRSA